MHVCVIAVQLVPGQAVQAKRLWQESVLPGLQLRPEWKDGSFALTCLGKALLFTVWANEEAARGFAETWAYQKGLNQLRSLTRGEFEATCYGLGTLEEETLARCQRPVLSYN